MFTTVLDAGHGVRHRDGYDRGASSGGVYESLLNLKIARRCFEMLQNSGDYKITRDCDMMEIPGPYVTWLEAVVRFTRQHDADLFISNHCNASGNADAHGLQVYCYNLGSRHLAEALYEEIIAAARFAGYDLVSRWSGVKVGAFYVIRESPAPLAVLIEHGFLTNPLDRDWLNSPLGQITHAYAVAKVLLEGGF